MVFLWFLIILLFTDFIYFNSSLLHMNFHLPFLVNKLIHQLVHLFFAKLCNMSHFMTMITSHTTCSPSSIISSTSPSFVVHSYMTIVMTYYANHIHPLFHLIGTRLVSIGSLPVRTSSIIEGSLLTTTIPLTHVRSRIIYSILKLNSSMYMHVASETITIKGSRLISLITIGSITISNMISTSTNIRSMSWFMTIETNRLI